MSQYVYRGDSPGKESARTQAYARLSQTLFYGFYHLVVAGECGDIDYLIRQGVKPNYIIACDREAKYRRMAKERGVIVPDGYGHDLVMTTKWAIGQDKSLASHNVDLCMSLINGAPILRECLDLLEDNHWTSRFTSVSFTFLCGHDPGLRKGPREQNPGQKRIDYYRQVVRRPLTNYYTYQSWTRESPGSPMCVAFL